MKRTVGKYKNKDIEIRDLHLTETYGCYLLGSRSDKSVNMEIVNVGIDRTIRKLFGPHTPYYISNYNEIEYSKPLAPETVYACLNCWAPVKRGNGSHLILVWLQQDNQDPFIMAAEKLKSVNWEKEAHDFEL